MRVLKRSGILEDVSFDKVLQRLRLLSDGLRVDHCDVARQVCGRIYDGVKTTDLDELAANLCSSLAIEDPDYGVLAARVLVSNLHKNTLPSFSQTIERLYRHDPPLIADDVYGIVRDNAERLDAVIDHSRDDWFDYFGFKTLERSYLLKIDGAIVERPQHLFMRVAVGIHKDDLESALETYDGMSTRRFTHATPTLFNAGTPRPQLSSCYLLQTNEDSLEGIFDTFKECGQISKYAGGIGLSVHDVRAKGAIIKGTDGTSDGLVPMLRVLNNVARYINQAGRRAGSIAVYLEPWHADVFEVLDLRKPHGHEEERARDLFYAMWVPDLFMKRVETDGVWSLMTPDVSRGLSDVWGKDFEDLYETYEREGKFVRQVAARELWRRIVESQVETGMPYLTYKDAANAKSNQQNLGTIKSSNLCVAPETRVLTRTGSRVIRDLRDEEVEVWNGERWSRVVVRQTGVDQPLLTVTCSSGERLECTPYHRFYVRLDESDRVVVVVARDLQPGMKLAEWTVPDSGDASSEVKIESVTDEGRRDDTYCFNEPLAHAGIFNGIRTGNCSEILEYTSPDEISVCNLSSICLPTFVSADRTTYDFDGLHATACRVTKNLDRVVDVTFYPLEKARRSNLRHRPIGIGVQGLADAYALMRMPFDSDEARVLNRRIFETIYHAAVQTSMELAKAHGKYSTFDGSPASEGRLQFDLWGVAVDDTRHDWTALKADVRKHGLRNSLLVAPMPTASTSQIMGFNECFEPFTSNIYKRRTMAGEFILVNRHLVRELQALGLWTEAIRTEIIVRDGSVQGIAAIPDHIRAVYKTAFELSQKVLIDQAADRGAFVCQSQSLNLFADNPDYKVLTSMHFYAWRRGLKTGVYYLRTRAKARAQQFTIDPTVSRDIASRSATMACGGDGGACTLCSA